MSDRTAKRYIEQAYSHQLGLRVLSKNKPLKAALTICCQSMTAMRAGMALTSPISFAITSGSYLQIRGANGVGKSTFLRQLAGLIPSDLGTMTINDKPYKPSQDRLSLKTVYLGHRDGLHGDLTAIENITLLCGSCPEEIVDTPLYQRPVSSYSAGQRQRLNILTLFDDADLWLLDEPSSNLDGDNLVFLERKIKSFIASGGIVIAATHADIGEDDVTMRIHLEKATSQPAEGGLL